LAVRARDTVQRERVQAASRFAAQDLTRDRSADSYEGVLLEAVCGRYARLHGTTIVPELDEPGPQWAISVPDAVPELPAGTADFGR